MGTHDTPDGCRVTLLKEDMAIRAPQWVDIRSWDEVLVADDEAPKPRYNLKPESIATDDRLDVNTTNRYRLAPYTTLPASCQAQEQWGWVGEGGGGGGGQGQGSLACIG